MPNDKETQEAKEIARIETLCRRLSLALHHIGLERTQAEIIDHALKVIPGSRLSNGTVIELLTGIATYDLCFELFVDYMTDSK